MGTKKGIRPLRILGSLFSGSFCQTGKNADQVQRVKAIGGGAVKCRFGRRIS